MKTKYVFLTILIIIGHQTINAQNKRGSACAIYDNNRDIEGMRSLLLGEGLYSLNLRIAYASAINHNIGAKVVTSSKESISEILDNTTFFDIDFVVPSDYYNGVRYGDNISFTSLTGQPSENWAAYRYEGVDYIYAKVSCMNPQKKKNPGLFIVKKTEERSLLTGKLKQKYADPLPLDDSETEESILYNDEEGPIVDLIIDEKESSWLKRNKGWLIPVAAGLVTVGTGFIAHDKNHYWYFWFPKVKPGSPGGAPITRDPIVPDVPDVPQGPGGAPITH